LHTLHHPAFPAVLAFVALLMIAIPCWVLIERQRTRQRGVAGIGTIVEKEELPYKGMFHCWVEFAGRRCRVALHRETWQTLRRGQPLDILYDPDKPGAVTYGERDSFGPALLSGAVIVLGLCAAAVALALWLR
jgi:hypothetical protein